MINKIIKGVRENAPLIHCITNPVSINQCANAVLAVGGRPIMAEHPKEAAEITAFADALVLNLGNITDVRMESMKISQSVAEKIPVILDLVGVACSKLRRDFAFGLLEHRVDLIKGNYSEIKALADASYKSYGVDSQFNDVENISKTAFELSKKYSTIVLASGKTDIITDGNRFFYVNNGTKQLASVTGTGCMLGALCGCYMTVCKDIYGALTACKVLGICGEKAETYKGSGTFMVNLLDELSKTEGIYDEKF